MASKKWTENETTLALSFYYEIPFGKISYTNPFIEEKSRLIHRTPGALAMKLANLASLDDSLLKRGVTSLTHISTLDKIIWNKYKNNYALLLEDRDRILAKLKDADTKRYPETDSDIHLEALPQPDHFSVERTIIVRNGQNFFRNAVLSAYNYQCCMTGIAIPELLQACHIKPWSKCDQTNDCIDPANGLCLNYLCHKAFDTGLISVHKNEKTIMISRKLEHHKNLDETTRSWLLSLKNKSIIMPHRNSPDKIFLEYHNDCVFQK
ncbi:HNH endonuclease [Selenomonas sp. FC4001]|uniref:HNH endonuclease n=1 Tax=Selenomonas sp. FC4001 TaxID=1408313 RepID=UPI00056D4EA2|nr:HNH endonuclease [Selenomonas sp. FC4001]